MLSRMPPSPGGSGQPIASRSQPATPSSPSPAVSGVSGRSSNKPSPGTNDNGRGINAIPFLTLTVAPGFAQATAHGDRVTWDLLFTGGEPFDVAVTGGRIAATGPSLPRDAHTVVDIAGRLITPGLIDMHTHVGPGYWGIEPDPIAWYTGVTTWVDAGSAGAYTLAGLRRVAAAAEVRVPALLNISAIGLAGRTGESRDLANCDVALAIDTIQANRSLIRGVKVRIDQETVGD